MKPETEATPKLFIEKFEYLLSTAYVRRGEEITNMTVKRDDDGEWIVDFDMPSKDERDSFLMTFRMFYRNGDGISLSDLEKLFDDPGISEKWKDGHKKWRTIVNNQLDEEVCESSKYGKLSYRTILEIYLYGYISHLNPRKLEMFRYFTKDEFSSQFFEFDMNTAALIFIHGLNNIYWLSLEELGRDLADSK